MRRSRYLLGINIALACSGTGSAAVPGLPEPPAPVPLPVFWLDTGNDSLSDQVENRDDFRTGTLDAGYIGHGFAVAANSSILTDRARQRRSDQVTATLGYAYTPVSAPGSYLSAGVGLRAWGDFGGQHVQNLVHRNTGITELSFPYDPGKRFDPLVYASGRYVLLTDTPDWASYFGPPGRWGAMISGAGLATCRRDFEGELELDALYAGRQGSLWLGTRFHDEGGNLPGTTELAVASRERGWWLMVGSSLKPSDHVGVVVDAGIDPHTLGAFGRFGIDVYPDQERPTRQEQAVEVDLGAYSGDDIGLQLRWRPLPLLASQPEWLRRWLRSEVLIDYRFGNIRDVSFRDDSVDSDQLLVGPAETITPPSLFGVLKIMPYGYAGAGVRIERLQPDGPDPAFPAQQTMRGVAQIGFGVRLGTTFSRDPDDLVFIDRIHIGAGYDRWFPFVRATASSGADSTSLQTPNWSVGSYVGFLLDW